jgi:hypothetical protein
MLMREQAEFDLALRLRNGTAAIGEIYAFISGLYFRGKLAYTGVFGAAPSGVPPAMVIVPGMGLVPPGTILSYDQLQSIANVPVDADNPAYREPFLRDVALLDQQAGRGGLMLRCARTTEELAYIAVQGATRHGNRPPKLKPSRQK